MTLRQSIITILGLAVAIGLIGAGIGGSIGLFLPDFYRTVFRIGIVPLTKQTEPPEKANLC